MSTNFGADSIAVRRSASVNEGAGKMTVNAILEPSRATRRQDRSTPSLSGVQHRRSEWVREGGPRSADKPPHGRVGEQSMMLAPAQHEISGEEQNQQPERQRRPPLHGGDAWDRCRYRINDDGGIVTEHVVH